jgi:hypothetical protein
MTATRQNLGVADLVDMRILSDVNKREKQVIQSGKERASEMRLI